MTGRDPKLPSDLIEVHAEGREPVHRDQPIQREVAIGVAADGMEQCPAEAIQPALDQFP
jgi:hypothetical protein